MIDTHCHLTFPDFAGKIDTVLAEAAAAGVTGAITISTTTRDCFEALRIAKSYTNVWCTAGVHPLHSHEVGASGRHEWGNLRVVAEDPKCVAWGELGLDNHSENPPRKVQDAVLEEQLAFIESSRGGEAGGKAGREAGGGEGAVVGGRAPIDLPIVLHCREAFDDLIPILKRTSLDPTRFVFHCFTGSPAEMRKVLDLGSMVSFTGVATYRSAREVREAACLPPPDRLMVETDAPFLSPEPHRGERPCRPAWVRHTASALAALRGEAYDAFHEAVNRNTTRFFGVPA